MESVFDKELDALVETARRFAKKEILGKVVKLDSLEKPAFPWEAIQSGGEAGFLTGPLDADLGGADLGLDAMAVLVEHLAEGATGPAAIFATHLAAVTKLADRPGAKALLEQMAEHCADEKPFLFGVALPATAVPLDRPASPIVEDRNGDLEITGDFLCLPSPDLCRHVLVATGEKADYLAVLDGEKLRPYSFDAYPGSGLDEFHPAGLKLDGVKATDDEVIGSAPAATLYRDIRVLLSAAQVGNARAAANYAFEYAHERVQTGRKIIEHQQVRKMIEGMFEKVEAAMGSVRLAANAPDGDAGCGIARRAYTSVGTAVEEVCQDAVQSLGGYGYMKDYGIEKRLRDAKSLQCLLGTYPEDVLGGP